MDPRDYVHVLPDQHAHATGPGFQGEGQVLCVVETTFDLAANDTICGDEYARNIDSVQWMQSDHPTRNGAVFGIYHDAVHPVSEFLFEAILRWEEQRQSEQTKEATVRVGIYKLQSD